MRQRNSSTAQNRVRLNVERLEDRTVPALLFLDTFDDGNHDGWEVYADGSTITPTGSALRFAGSGGYLGTASMSRNVSASGDLAVQVDLTATGPDNSGWSQSLHLQFMNGDINLFDSDAGGVTPDCFGVNGTINPWDYWWQEFGDVNGMAGTPGLTQTLSVSRVGDLYTFKTGQTVLGTRVISGLGDLQGVRINADQWLPGEADFVTIVDNVSVNTLETTLYWIAPGGGDWHHGSNWSLGRPPYAHEDAVIDRPGATVTVNGAAVARSLTASANMAVNGSLTLGASSTVSGSMNVWATVSVAADTTLTLSGGGTIGHTLLINDGATVNLTAGTFTVISDTSLSGTGTLRIGGASTFWTEEDVTVRHLILMESGTLDGPEMLTVTESLSWTSGSMRGWGETILASGAVATVSGAAKTLDKRWLTVEAGATLNLSGGDLAMGNAALLSNAGIVDIVSDTAITTFGVLATILNTGTFRVAGGEDGSTIDARLENAATVEMQAPVYIRDLRQFGTPAAVTRFRGGVPVIVRNAELMIGRLELLNNSTMTVRAEGQLRLGNVTLEGGTISAAGATDLLYNIQLSNLTLNLSGTTVWQGNDIQLQQVTINNQTGGNFRILRAELLGGVGVFNNQGSLRLLPAGEAPVVEFNLTEFNNSGQVVIERGKFSLAGSTSGRHSGVFDTAEQATLEFAGDKIHTLIPGILFFRTGWIRLVESAGWKIEGFTVHINSLFVEATDSINIKLVGHAVDYGTLKVSRRLDWAGGMFSAMNIELASTTTATFSDNGQARPSLRSSILTNYGVVAWTGEYFGIDTHIWDRVDAQGNFVLDPQGRRIEDRNRRSFVHNNGIQGQGRFLIRTEAGVISSNDETTVMFVDAGGWFGRDQPLPAGVNPDIEINKLTLINRYSTVVLDHLTLDAYTQFGGVTQVSTGETRVRFRVDLDGYALFNIDSAATLRALDFVVRNAFLHMAGGTLRLVTQLSIYPSGTLSGSGLMVGDVASNGRIRVGDADQGTLTIEGDFVQGQYGELELEAADGSHDQLVVQGNATLGGKLSVVSKGDFIPDIGDTFRLITANALIGQFAEIGFYAFGGVTVTTAQTATTLDLRR